VLGRPLDDTITDEELFVLAFEKQFTQLEKMRLNAFALAAEQSIKKQALFFRGLSEGFSMFLNEDGEFSGDGH
jgi:hypothetical protein